MFTGLVQHIAVIHAIRDMADKGKSVTFHSPMLSSDIVLGCSIMHDGICLTVIECGLDDGVTYYICDLSPETLSCTNAQYWAIGDYVNSEPSLRVGDELGGHFVLGHVDNMATIRHIEQGDEYWICRMAIPDEWLAFIAAKGSIALNGVSLTINNVYDDGFDVTLIPHTISHTTWQYLNINDIMNFEIDPLMRYSARIMEFTYGNT